MRSAVTTQTLKKMKTDGQRFACLTAYDACFAAVLEQAGVEVLLVGDSLGMVIQGKDTTIPVTMEEMIYHSASVRRGSKHALVMVDMPFMSCATPELALQNAGRLMKEGGSHMVKVEGAQAMVEAVYLMSAHGIPVCSHLGLLPQTVHKMGGYKVQGRDNQAAEAMLEDAQAMEEAGADMLLLECVPAALAKRITDAVSIPVIGIGAGAGCDGQVLVLHDMLGITPGKRPSFSKSFMTDAADIPAAIKSYVNAVKAGEFPSSEHSF
jgi:3-methyl-2-oxobutanoate hydroxymethyltransferase